MTEEVRKKRSRRKTLNHVKAYKLRRKALIIKMGGCCEECGKKRKLEFHHPNGRDWSCRDLSRWSRMVRYERDYENGELELLCRSCNAGINPSKEEEEEWEEDVA